MSDELTLVYLLDHLTYSREGVQYICNMVTIITKDSCDKVQLFKILDERKYKKRKYLGTKKLSYN